MGQYYKAILLDKNKEKIVANISSYDYDSGSKLMEHSWMKNDFVKSVESLIYKNAMPVVWAGDYADAEDGSEEGPNLYRLSEEKTKLQPTTSLPRKKSRYIINHITNEYVDKDNVPKDDDGWQVHPLPLLTCEGNGRGGGDYRGDSEIVGSWARDSISVSEDLPEGYTELEFNIKE
jgi:hypothetical protein